MPIDGSGLFTRSYSFTQDRDNGIKIQAARMDGEFDNFAAAVNQAFLRSGLVSMTGTLKLGNNDVTGLASGVVGAPAMRFNADATTGVYMPAAGKVALAAGGVNRVEANSTGAALTGDVTISGAATVGGNLAVTGTAAFGNTTVTGTLNASAALQVGGNPVATQAFVTGSYAPLASPALTGTPTAPTAATNTNTTQLATTAYVIAQIAASGIPTTVSPAFTGTPTSPTAAQDTNTTQIATTAFVCGQAGSASPLMAGAAATGTSLRFARQDHVHPTDTSRAPLASPTFTGTPAAPTAATNTNTTQLATTAFVMTQIASYGYAPLASPALTGTPTAPTAAGGTNNTQLATTAFVANAVGSITTLPPGAVIAMAANSVPSGYLECNGQEVSRITYAALFAAIGTNWGAGNGSTTFNVPDFRGEFLRGFDNGRGVDVSRTFATWQDSQLGQHQHSYYNVQNGGSGWPGGSGGSLLFQNTGLSGGASNSSETRPRNWAVLYLIKT